MEKLTKEYILNCLDKYCHFSNELCDGTVVADIIEPLQNAECFPKGEWVWDAGVSKVVLIFSNLPFVIKIPFIGEEIEVDTWDEENECYTDEYSYEFYPFTLEQAPDRVCDRYAYDHWDYCDIEVDRYFLASDNNLKECFAKTELLGFAQNHPIYIQERAIMFNQSEESKHSDEEYTKASNLRQEHGFYINIHWVMDFIFYYGEKMFKALADFCEKYDIEDLHDGNIGYIGGRPCLVDYSSYYGV